MKGKFKRFLLKMTLLSAVVFSGYYYFFAREILNTADLCHIYDRRPHWDWVLDGIEEDTGVDRYLILAFMKQESSFKSNARPPFKKLWGFIPYWERLSSSHGYSQAVNGTWEMYQRNTGDFEASRTSFSDSAEFISWYVQESYKRNKIRSNDAYNLYLSYHEGWGGFNKQSYSKKKGLASIAKRVDSQSKKYKQQANSC